MPNPRAARQARRSKGEGDEKLNITSMMDMFTIILVFLLKSFSTEGQLVTPAEGLTLPTSKVEKHAKPGLSIKVSDDRILVEDKLVLEGENFENAVNQKGYLIEKLKKVLDKYAKEGRKSSEMYGEEFSGEVTIQGDVTIPYRALVRIIYTCGQAGFPKTNLIVYREG